MKRFEYDVFAFRQQAESPVQVAFVAFAQDILSWSGVPRKSDELLTGYQRFRDDARIEKEIVPFFQDPHNCSPTAIIVALRQAAGIGTCTLEPTDIPPGQIVSAKLTIELRDELLGTEEVFEAAQRYVNARLAGEEDSADESATDEEEDGGNDEDDESAEEEADNTEIMHLGSETLARMKAVLDDRANWDRPGFREAITDYVKPAFLIDGQHRVSGASKLGHNGLPFMVCGLFDAPWEEQVFQFTVVNLKPRRIPPSLITAIAGLSLTRAEHDQVQARLEKAGVKVVEVEIMSLVAYEPSSPFYEKVNMAVAGPTAAQELLGYGGMKRIAKVWWQARRSSLANIARGVIGTKNTSTAKLEWRNSRCWFDFFVAFWSEIRDHYGAPMWEKTETNKLMNTANLWALQEVLLGAADGQRRSSWEVSPDVEGVEERSRLLREKLLEVVRETIDYFPGEMWTTKWAKSSQDTNDGRKELVALFQQFVSEGQSHNSTWRGWRSDPWFKDANGGRRAK